MNKAALNKNLEALAKNREDTAKLNAEYIQKLELEIGELKTALADIYKLSSDIDQAKWPSQLQEIQAIAELGLKGK